MPRLPLSLLLLAACASLIVVGGAQPTSSCSLRPSNAVDLTTISVDSSLKAVVVQPGVVAYLDRSLLLDNVTSVLVRGALHIVAPSSSSSSSSPTPTTLSLRARSLVVDANASLVVGSRACPLPAWLRVDIALVADANDATSGMFHVRREAASVQMHGSLRGRAWARLDETAHVNATSLLIDSPLDVAVGDEVLVMTTDYDYSLNPIGEVTMTERVVVTSVAADRRRIDFTPPLEYMHYGRRWCAKTSSSSSSSSSSSADADCVDTRGEVAVLTRNVRVRAADVAVDANTSAPAVGVTSLLESSSLAIDGVEFAHGGRAGVVDAYALHVRARGSVVAGSYVRRCAVHTSALRGIVLSWTSRLLLADNVVHNVIGHGIVVGTTGVEIGNSFEYNLVGLASDAGPFISDAERSAAGFFITNAANYFVGNVAAGSRRGYEFGLLLNPVGVFLAEASEDAWRWRPHRMPLGAFVDNVAHSNTDYGVIMDREYFHVDETTTPDGRYGEFFTTFIGPLDDSVLVTANGTLNASSPTFSNHNEDDDDDVDQYVEEQPDVSVVFRSTTVYKTNEGIRVTSGRVFEAHGTRCADAGYCVRCYVSCVVHDLVAVGDTDNIGNPTRTSEGNRTRPRRNIVDEHAGVRLPTWAGPFAIVNSRFYAMRDETNETAGGTRTIAAISNDEGTNVMAPRNMLLNLSSPDDDVDHALLLPRPEAGTWTEALSSATTVYVDVDGSLASFTRAPGAACGDVYVVPSARAFVMPPGYTGCVAVPSLAAERCPGPYSPRLVYVYDRSDTTHAEMYTRRMRIVRTRDRAAVSIDGERSGRSDIYYVHVSPNEEFALEFNNSMMPRRMRIHAPYSAPGDSFIFHIPLPPGIDVSTQLEVSYGGRIFSLGTTPSWFYRTFVYEPTTSTLSVVVAQEPTGMMGYMLERRHELYTRQLVRTPWLDVVLDAGLAACAGGIECSYAGATYNADTVPSRDAGRTTGGYSAPPYSCWRRGSGVPVVPEYYPALTLSPSVTVNNSRQIFVRDHFNGFFENDPLDAQVSKEYAFFGTQSIHVSFRRQYYDNNEGVYRHISSAYFGIANPPQRNVTGAVTSSTFLSMVVRGAEPETFYLRFLMERDDELGWYTNQRPWMTSQFMRSMRHFSEPVTNAHTTLADGWRRYLIPIGPLDDVERTHIRRLQFIAESGTDPSTFNLYLDQLEIVELPAPSSTRADAAPDDWSWTAPLLANVHPRSGPAVIRRIAPIDVDSSSSSLSSSSSIEHVLVSASSDSWRYTTANPLDESPVFRIDDWDAYVRLLQSRYNITPEYVPPPPSNAHLNTNKHWADADFVDSLWFDGITPIGVVGAPLGPWTPRRLSTHMEGVATPTLAEAAAGNGSTTSTTTRRKRQYYAYGGDASARALNRVVVQDAFFRRSVVVDASVRAAASELRLRIAADQPTVTFVNGERVDEESADRLRPATYWNREIVLPPRFYRDGGGIDEDLVVGVRVRSAVESRNVFFDAELVAVVPSSAAASLAPAGESTPPVTDVYASTCDEGAAGCACGGGYECAGGLRCVGARCVDAAHRVCAAAGALGCACAPTATSTSIDDAGELVFGHGVVGGSCNDASTSSSTSSSSSPVVCSSAGFCVVERVCSRGAAGCLCRTHEPACDAGASCARVTTSLPYPRDVARLCVTGFNGSAIVTSDASSTTSVLTTISRRLALVAVVVAAVVVSA